MLTSFFVSFAVLASYLCLYTAFSKTTKTLDANQLIGVLTIREGWDHTLVEINKVISLAGLTVGMLYFCPFVHQELRSDLLLHSTVMLWLHAAYSSYKYYGSKNIPHLSTFVTVLSDLQDKRSSERAVGMKKLSIIMGVVAQVLVSAGYFDYGGWTSLFLAIPILGIAHFYTMEIDYKWSLKVRPYGMLPFVLLPIVIFYTLS